MRPGHRPARRPAGRHPRRRRDHRGPAHRAHRRARTSSRRSPRCRAAASDEVVLEAKDITGGPLRGVSFELHQGEVLGVAGLLGSGRSELLKMAFGAYPIRVRRRFELDGKPVRVPPHRRRHGRRHRLRPRGPRHRGLVPRPDAVRERQRRHGRPLLEGPAAAEAHGRRRRPRVDPASSSSGPRSERQTMGTLSGGNQQKVVLARWLRRRAAGAAARRADPGRRRRRPGRDLRAGQPAPSPRAARCCSSPATSRSSPACADRVIVLADGTRHHRAARTRHRTGPAHRAGLHRTQEIAS